MQQQQSSNPFKRSRPNDQTWLCQRSDSTKKKPYCQNQLNIQSTTVELIKQLKCPFSYCLIQNPVILSDGYSYEKKNLHILFNSYDNTNAFPPQKKMYFEVLSPVNFIEHLNPSIQIQNKTLKFALQVIHQYKNQQSQMKMKITTLRIQNQHLKNRLKYQDGIIEALRHQKKVNSNENDSTFQYNISLNNDHPNINIQKHLQSQSSKIEISITQKIQLKQKYVFQKQQKTQFLQKSNQFPPLIHENENQSYSEQNNQKNQEQQQIRNSDQQQQLDQQHQQHSWKKSNRQSSGKEEKLCKLQQDMPYEKFIQKDVKERSKIKYSPKNLKQKIQKICIPSDITQKQIKTKQKNKIETIQKNNPKQYTKLFKGSYKPDYLKLTPLQIKFIQMKLPLINFYEDRYYIRHDNIKINMTTFLSYDWSKLQQISLGNCAINQQEFEIFMEHGKNFPVVQYIDFQKNQIKRITKGLQTFKQLKYIDFGKQQPDPLQEDSRQYLIKFRNRFNNVKIIFKNLFDV